jgi:hypothetical protein
MLIEFKIQVDESGGATVVPAGANTVDPTKPKQVELGTAAAAAATPSTTAAANPTATTDGKGGATPGPDPGTGTPSGGPSSVFIIGPIVVFGSGTGQGVPGGATPGPDPGTGTPDGDKTTTTKSTA